MSTPPSKQWDLWLDAAQLAERLSMADSRLVAVIGAESWCQKCRQIRPRFDAAAQLARPNETWLWLDLEDHAEFIGTHIPDNLPMLLCYEQSKLAVHGVWPMDANSFEEAMQSASKQPPQQEIGLFHRLTTDNWSV